ncbi:ATP-dependent DNA helicase DinG [Gammaproteobacteria bacterium]|nr:ATP-dependent DNA helicase DinG [Gammaproteobacteria bacterium]
MVSVLTEQIKQTIQGAYRDWLAANQFKPRRAQREMIGFIARSVTMENSRLAVVEAGTGTGKTVAYCLSAIPIAQALGKKLIISTATVNLQEQVFLKDLPDVRENAGLDFVFDLVKGRGRYLCLKRLDEYLRNDNQEEMLFLESVDSEQIELYQEMLTRFSANEWNGELDSWEGNLEQNDWKTVTNDHRGCTNNRCTFFHQCPFFRARGALEKADVIVSNHDLLLSDLGLGGGAILSEPGSSIYVIDEAHHLAEKTRGHFTLSAGISGTIQWLESANNTIGSMVQQLSRPPEFVELAAAIAVYAHPVQLIFEEIGLLVSELIFETKEEGRSVHRFPLGKVPKDLTKKFIDAVPLVIDLSSGIGKIHERLQQAIAGDVDWLKGADAGNWLGPIGALSGRASSLQALVQDYSSVNSSDPMCARWLSKTGAYCDMYSAPIEPGEIVNRLLWKECHAAICTSATLSVGGRFDRFLDQSGLDPKISQLRLRSTFNFPEIATFNVPNLKSDPRDFDAHTEEIIGVLPDLIREDPSALILFSSWRQLNAVIKGLPDELTAAMLVQGDDAKQLLISSHRESIAQNKPSYLVGLSSFSEGLDLPGDLCRHVVIAKIPFAMPDDPVDQTLAEWVESQGRNAFYEISVPDAALKLVQACGRLIRNEQDFGKITLLDNRVMTKSYGKILMDSLPPYQKVIGQ